MRPPPPPQGEGKTPSGENCALKESNRLGAMWKFAMKKFFLLFWSLTLLLRAKLLCTPQKIVYAPQARYTGAGPAIGTMLTKSTKNAQPNKLIVSIVPTLPSLPAMRTDLACYAYRPCLLCLS